MICDLSSFLNIGTTFANFRFSGKDPVEMDWFIISVIQSLISLAIDFRMALLMLSCPQLLEGFRLDKYCRVVALLIVLNLKLNE